jgi:hypothetical protein
MRGNVCCRKCLRHIANKTNDPLLPLTVFVVCQVCGNKRCPKAEDHAQQCTGSNEPC